jgi:uncharacterized protein
MNQTATHSNALLLKKLYSDFSRGDVSAVLAACAEEMTFSIPGKSALAGKYTKATFASDFVTKLMELSGGTIQLTVHDILANDQHGVALISETLTRNGQKLEFRGCHIWRFQNGKPLAGYAYPRDLYQYDQIWS